MAGIVMKKFLICALAFVGCGSPETPVSVDDPLTVIDQNPDDDEAGFVFHTSYQNFVLSGSSDRGTVVFIGGSHDHHFPYPGVEAWEDGLLKVGDEGYTFTRFGLGALRIQLSLSEGVHSTGRIRYAGTMVRVGDGAEVPVAISLNVRAEPGEARNLGTIPGGLVPGEFVPGMRWQPHRLVVTRYFIRVGDTVLRNVGLHGGIERGELTGVRSRSFSLAYDYLHVVRPGSYSYVEFGGRALFPDAPFGGFVDWFARTFGSAQVTTESTGDRSGNVHGVSDQVAVLFESSVDLGIATLRRQLVQTTDRAGRALYGLNEVFEAAEPPTLERLAELSLAELKVVFETAEGADHNKLLGPYKGRALAFHTVSDAEVPRALLSALTASHFVPWAGKTFSADGTGFNRIALSQEYGIAHFDHRSNTSVLGNFPVVELLYHAPFGAIRDEIREVADGVWLGLAFVQVADQEVALFGFALEKE